MYSLIVIDDEKELREGLSLYFPWEKFGFEMTASFGNGKDALTWLKENTIDVVLTDIRMPFMSGLELIREIKKNSNNSIIFCLLSAHRDFAYAKEGINLGVRHYLLKPTDFDEIGEAFESIRKELDQKNPQISIGSKEYNPLIQKAIRIMAKNPEKSSLQSLSEALGASMSYLSRLFKKETGENFSTILTRLRMEKASTLLICQFQYTNKEIAAMLGYQDSQNFCRSFRHFFNMTPGEYRKEHLNVHNPPLPSSERC